MGIGDAPVGMLIPPSLSEEAARAVSFFTAPLRFPSMAGITRGLTQNVVPSVGAGHGKSGTVCHLLPCTLKHMETIDE